MLLIVFAVSMFASATLLFLVEPMLAKMALPLLGGSPAVWNTCLVFFQAVLLAGYLYAYAATRWLGRRLQIALHLAVALTPLLILPLHIPAGWEPPSQSNPVLWILAMLSIAVGLPFFVLSASTPILQRWFSHTGHAHSSDPYFLYAASNAGSLVGLLGYPLLLEPTLRISQQSHLWSYGYGVFIALTATCAALVWRAQPAVVSTIPVPADQIESSTLLTVRQRIRWIALAFIPSSLMLGVTTALTTDVPAIPLFWVLPLAFYLLSFVLVFAKRPPISHQWMVQRLPFLILAALIPTICKIQLPLLALIVLYLLTLFAVAMVCHGELARSRPAVSHLTEFYLWISFGGVLGGIFNALLAPVIFSTVLEFPIALILAALARPSVDNAPLSSAQSARARRNDWLLPIALGLAMAAALIALPHAGMNSAHLFVVLIFGASMLWCLRFGKRPLRFAVGVLALLAASTLYNPTFGQAIHVQRNFFGVLRVTDSLDGKYHLLLHGATLHGSQSLDPSKSREPLAYYTTTGPAGSILRALQSKSLHSASGDLRKPNWAVVGLGAGTMACYLQPGETLTYYEINPGVKTIAEDPRYFTFLQQCAPQTQIVLGDARLKLRDAADGSYDLIVLDAFSGDMIPMHLVTREALALYLRKLAPGGIIAFHTSNLYLQLGPTLCNLARDARLVCLIDDDNPIPQAEKDAGKFPSEWLVMARNSADLGPIATDPHWKPVPVPTHAEVWTDDYSDLLGIIKWK